MIHLRKLLFYSFLPIFILLLSTPIALAQKNYDLQLSSGTFPTKENALEYIKQRKTNANHRLESKNLPTIIQFFDIPTEAQKKRIAQSGIQLLAYLPHYAYTAILPSQLSENQVKDLQIRAFVALPVAAKFSPLILKNQIPPHALINENLLALDISLFAKEGLENVAKEITNLKGKIIRKSEFFNTITVYLPKNQVENMANLAWVQFISPSEAPVAQKNEIGRNRHTVNVLNNAPLNLTGNGVIVGVWDGTLRPHIDFGGRIVNREIYNDFTDTNENDHGNHVGGVVASAGILDPAARSAAPQATLFSYSFGDNNDGRIDANVFIEDEVLTAINPSNPSQGAVITQNSFGPTIAACDGLDAYPNRARRRDLLARNFPFLTQCVSAGNEQAVCSSGGGFRTLSDATKNAIIVGSVDNADVVATSSSFGPTKDGRLKPDIAAIGVNVFSTLFDDQYGTKSGTSFAAPAVSSVAALLYQRFRQLNGNENPTSDLIKGLLCNNADDINNLRPDYRTGFGRLNALNAIRALEDSRFERRSINQAQTNTRTITVAPNTAELKIMLAWADVEAAAGASIALVNNLNLQVTAPDGTVFLPWVLDPANPSAVATRQIDNLNNAEQVTIDNPISGTYTISVIGANVPQGAQNYALTWSANAFGREINFPQVGQSIRPNSAIIINWQQAGATSGGTQTAEFSTDGGGSWATIGTVNAPRTSITWNVPNLAPNAQVQVRVRGAFAPDIIATSGNFNVIGTPSNLTATGCGAVQLSWGAVAGATDYEVFAVNPINGNLTALPNSPTTTTNLTDTRILQVGQTYWYAVRARSGGIIGNRSIATSYTFTSNSPLIVTNTNDSGEGSLREAIARACPNAVISFAPNVSEVLLASSLIISKNLTINGGSGNRTVVVRRNAETPFRIFRVISGTVNMNNLTIQNGAVPDNGAGILNTGVLNLQNCYLLRNQAGFTGSALANGFEAVTGSNATLTNCVIAFNTASTDANIGATIQNGAATIAILTLQNCTMTENIGAIGRMGIRNTFAGTTLNLQNTIINQLQGSLNATATSVVVSTGGNLIPDNNARINHPTDLQNTDPRLMMFSPAFCSPAVNSGIGAIPATDILGNGRVGVTDRGAVEFTGQVPANPTFVVQNGNDSGEGSLREAITCAPEGTNITFSQSNTNVQLTSSELAVRRGLNIVGNGNTLVQRAENSPQFRVFNVENATATPVLLRNIVISNGQLSNIGNVEFAAFGGGIRLAGGTLNLENVQVRGNQAPQGAGIVANGNTTLNISNSFISNNISNASNNLTTRLAQRGGGIFIQNNANVNLTNSLVANNVASNGGAGIFSAGNLNLSSVTLAGNRNSNRPSASAANNTSAGLEMSNTASLVTQNTIFFHPDLANGNFTSASTNITSNGGNLSNDNSMRTALMQNTDLHSIRPIFNNPNQGDYSLACYDFNSVNVAVGNAVRANLPQTDILGRNRGGADIGAYSLQTCPIPSPTLLAQAANNSAVLSWDKNATPLAVSYEIYVFAANLSAQLVGTTTDNTFIVKDLKNGVSYNFYVVAVANLGQSDRSNTATARPSIVLANEEHLFDNQLIVYPNPSENEINFVLKSTQIHKQIQWRLVNISGQEIRSKTLKSNTLQEISEKISISSLPQGIYLLVIETASGVFYQKVEKL
jgi:hypothetical protein